MLFLFCILITLTSLVLPRLSKNVTALFRQHFRFLVKMQVLVQHISSDGFIHLFHYLRWHGRQKKCVPSNVRTQRDARLSAALKA